MMLKRGFGNAESDNAMFLALFESFGKHETLVGRGGGARGYETARLVRVVHMLLFVAYGVQHARTIEELEAISQNMGHETLEITLRYYAKQAGDDVKRLVTGLSRGHISESDEELFREFEAFKKWRNPKR